MSRFTDTDSYFTAAVAADASAHVEFECTVDAVNDRKAKIRHWNPQRTYGRRARTREEFEREFWARVNKTESCWTWIGASNGRGYGHVQSALLGNVRTAHRAGWIIQSEWRSIPDGAWVLHHCDNPACIRIDHLYLGTFADNLRDAMERKRFNGSHRGTFRPGARHRLAKLSKEDANCITRLYLTGNYRLADLGKRYSVAQSTIHMIIHGTHWSVR